MLYEVCCSFNNKDYVSKFNSSDLSAVFSSVYKMDGMAAAGLDVIVSVVHILKLELLNSESNQTCITTDGQSVCLGVRHPSVTCGQFFSLFL
jgi:hypothetical protein